MKTIFRPGCLIHPFSTPGLCESPNLSSQEKITLWASFLENILYYCFPPDEFCLIVANLSDVATLTGFVSSLDRWWAGMYHVWSTGNAGVFCGVAQVSQCGSLSKGVSNFFFEPYHISGVLTFAYYLHGFAKLASGQTRGTYSDTHILIFCIQKRPF